MSSLANLVSAFTLWMLDQDGAYPCGLSQPDAAALLAVRGHEGCSVSDVGSMLGLSHSGAVRACDRLQAAGLIVREAGMDRRHVALSLSARGHDLTAAILQSRAERIAARLKPLNETEQDTLALLLSRLLETAAQQRPDAWRICRACDHGICRGDDCPVGRGVP